MALGILVASRTSTTSSTLLRRSSTAFQRTNYKNHSICSSSSGASSGSSSGGESVSSSSCLSMGMRDLSEADGSTVRSSWVYVEMSNVNEEVPLSSSSSSSSSPHPFHPLSLESKINLLRWQTKRCSVSSCESYSTAGHSVTRSLSRLSFIDDVSSELWKENPDRDSYNTFSVSEEELTRIIKYLESKLDGSQCINSSLDGSDSVINCASNDIKQVVSPTVTFILDTYCNMYLFGKQDLREMKRLQKSENKQYQALIVKAQVAKELQDKKFEMEMQGLLKTYEQDLDGLTRQQKQQAEKVECNQAMESKTAAKKIKIEQEKELKIFKEQQRQDMKLLKQELDLLPKDTKKESLRKRKEEKEIELADKERQFLENQRERMEKHMKQLTDQHRQKIALLESQYLQQKQQLLRAREAALWEMEKNQLHDKHQQEKGQLKDLFFLKRHQMLNRHVKEIEQMKRSNAAKEEETQRYQILDKRRHPKVIKSQSKIRAQMFKQSLRLSTVGTPEEDRVKMKQFEENEKKRMKSEFARLEAKHKKQWDKLLLDNETALKELEQIQAEKRKMLMEHETQKIKELDDQYQNELRKWKSELIPRKQKLEEEFFHQKEDQEKFYGNTLGSGDGNSESSLSPGSLRKKDSSSVRHSTII
ncbi:STE20-like serine serine/threonine-protein kinase isoform X2 [Octopus vulgaris]|uniref:STE20-like serine serine/threonine-protein kinase isoform X2 n=1 Tax=Octopus vulgaris TaxID=6645 RepID=A0AA36EZD0_OCTVU|nr:STE20-like serine serine/threonine-protein kinase isoform X2 [Octopus vulgaris]